MKILRIDNQDCCSLVVFNNLNELKEQLIDFHSIDYNDHFDENEKYKPIEDFTLQEILNWGDWDYKIITDKEAEEIE